MIPSSFTINNFSDENDLITQIYGGNSCQEKILEISTIQGHTNERKCKEQGQIKQVASERYRLGLKVDLYPLIKNIKIFILVLELLSTPSQQASFFKSLGMVQ